MRKTKSPGKRRPLAGGIRPPMSPKITGRHQYAAQLTRPMGGC